MNVDKKSQLTEKQLTILDSEMQKHKKSAGVAYVLWFFFGSIGLHQFYIGNTKKGFTYLGLGAIGWISMLTGFLEQSGFAISLGWILLAVLGILLLVDLFTMSKQIRDAEEREEAKIIEQLK